MMNSEQKFLTNSAIKLRSKFIHFIEILILEKQIFRLYRTSDEDDDEQGGNAMLPLKDNGFTRR